MIEWLSLLLQHNPAVTAKERINPRSINKRLIFMAEEVPGLWVALRHLKVSLPSDDDLMGLIFNWAISRNLYTHELSVCLPAFYLIMKIS